MIKGFAAALLCVAQVATAAQAAELPGERGITAQQRGTFAGARLRVKLGGHDLGKARASLSFTSVDRSRMAAGGERLRFAEGAEIALSKGEPVTLRLGGLSVADRLAAIPPEEADRKQKKTGKLLLKGAAVVAIVAVAAVGGLFLFYSAVCAGNRCDD